MERTSFDHERLDVYRLAIDYVALVYPLAMGLTGASRSSRDQWLRAAQSIALNIAEGNGKRSYKDRNRFLEIAGGSALECAAMHDVLGAWRLIDDSASLPGKTILLRLVAMLTKLIQR
ncbi:MAG: four helix bundle protein [Planctomycetales bacterium]|nr:four helix bundle protein [Planctomycetales bacterium]